MFKKIIAVFCFTLCVTTHIAFADEAVTNPNTQNTQAFSQAELQSPAGFWQTIDDKTNKPRSIVKIFNYNDRYYGRIIAAYYQPGEGPNDVCSDCSGYQKNEKILGMVFITKMWQNPDDSQQWIDGLILDPKNGNVYKSKMTLINGGKELEVRGYIGISLIGRSQVWKRVPKSILKELPASSVVAKNMNDDVVTAKDALD